MVTRVELEQFLRQLLNIKDFHDYCPNGLQIEGNAMISKIITGVSISQELIQEAIKVKADAILVHHGFFFKGENETITGIKKNRIKELLIHDINVFAYHLPLDCHDKLGNNAQLGKILGFDIDSALTLQDGYALGCIASVPELSYQDLSDKLEFVLQRKPVHAGSEGKENSKIKTVAWCTGAAQNLIEIAKEKGADAYISGEIHERTVLFAREAEIHYFAAGHHATERYGIKALGEYLANKFNLECQFIDIDNPV